MAPEEMRRRYQQAQQLLSSGRADEALRVLDTMSDLAEVSILRARAEALDALGRKAEAIDVRKRVVALAPGNAMGWHNLACLQGDLRRYADAERSTRRAVELGLSAPELWLVRGRALCGLDRLDEAEAAFRAALQQRPGDLDVLRELSRLVWARTGDVTLASQPLLAALGAGADPAGLTVELARLRDQAGDLEGGRALLLQAAAAPHAPPQLKASAAHLVLRSDPDKAVDLAAAALRAEPGSVDILRVLAEAHLARGDWRAAAPLADSVAAARPLDQGVLALQAVVRRLSGAQPALPWEDYQTLVRGRVIDVPPGWEDLTSYLADFAAELERLHVTRAHPIGQSLRGGTQSNQNLLESQEPATKAFLTAIDGPIRGYLAELGEGSDPIRSRNTGRYRLMGMWSVRLSGAGFHTDHVHPEGWLSSACHVVVPPAVEGDGRQGWLKFGEPGVATRPPLAAEHFVRPQPGRLVLFPSCMWHGTTPFTGPGVRLSVAFDIAPA